ncbi:ABC transporter permease [Candidatus Saccharibacteria bacterium]|nr:ABC transporter permease [Candidatus Saccharibacteria bacterium]
MFSGNYRTALKRLRNSKWLSILTMFGIVVGIVSVITTVSLGEGIKRQILSQTNNVGGNLLTVRPGVIVQRDKNYTITKINPALAYGFGSGSLNERDVDVVTKIEGVKDVSPINLLNSGVRSGDDRYDEGFVLGTNNIFPSIIRHKVEFGNYFSSGDESRQVAVIGKRVAEQLFKENVPVGQTLSIRGQDFVVRGVFEEFGSTTIGQGIDLNKAVFVPRIVLNKVADNSTQLIQILVSAKNENKSLDLAKKITHDLATAHGGQNDITVLRQDENLTVANDLLVLLTTFVASIAGISLLVGGIGIMNIMLVSISERTHEIGIRKAVGATNRQIRNQFMAEAIVLSFSGGVVGLAMSFIVNYILRITTNFHPFITWQVVVIATGVSIAVGVIFGTIPAIKAARKDPIQALRLNG